MVARPEVLILKAVRPDTNEFPKIHSEKEYNNFFLRIIIPYILSYFKLEKHIDYGMLDEDLGLHVHKEEAEDIDLEDVAVELAVLSEEKESLKGRKEIENFILSSHILEMTSEMSKRPKGYYEVFTYSPEREEAVEIWKAAPSFFLYPGIGGYVKVT